MINQFMSGLSSLDLKVVLMKPCDKVFLAKEHYTLSWYSPFVKPSDNTLPQINLKHQKLGSMNVLGVWMVMIECNFVHIEN